MDELYKKIFARNLLYYMEKFEKTQSDLISDLNINKSAISTWVNATRMPRMDKVQLLADYFGINKSDLLEDHTDENQYYTDPETAKLAQELMDNSYTRALMDASKDAKPEDIQMATDLLLRLKGTNNDG